MRGRAGRRIDGRDAYICVGSPARVRRASRPARKGLRLALDLGDRPFAPPLQPSKLATAPKRLSHMIVLDDARKIDAALMELVRAADARVN